MNREFLIQTLSSQGEILKSDIWDSDTTFGVGYPLHWSLEATKTSIIIRNLKNLSFDEIPFHKLDKTAYELGNNLELKIQPILQTNFSKPCSTSYISYEKTPNTAVDLYFKRTVFGSLISLGLFISVSIMVSPLFKTKEEALIPPQFAKIILTPPKRPSSAAQGSQSSELSNKRSTNLVQTFKTTQVQHSIQKLLKTQILSYLPRMDLPGSQKTPSAMSKIFEKSSQLKSLSPISNIDLSVKRTVAINTIGGNQEKGGNGIGYGKGDHASMQGQGSEFVSLNTPDSQVEEGLSKDEVGKAIHSHLAEVRYCYESAMIKNASLQGKIIIEFIIQGQGNVKKASLSSSTVGDQQLEQCMISHLLKWKFPAPKNGVEVTVSYPFIFKALGK